MDPADDPMEKTAARAPGDRGLGPYARATAAQFDRRTQRVQVTLSNGLMLGFLPSTVQGLEAATPAQLDQIEISPNGWGMHFPQLDADVFIPSLLEGVLGTRSWTAVQAGKRGGMAKTAQKAQAARANGRLGGRPRKKVTPAESR
ncbi:DUF2442 domain-containing protein [Hydrogenophaga sp. OTU3427]|uniref:DUF2442 domain-containing protein n=1 Tax=Hydrogenophaga sp. OTU3427 TaxID=3043856 RepID=UPI00313EB407